MLKNGPKILPKCYQNASNCYQNAPIMLPNPPKMIPIVTKLLTKYYQNATKTLPITEIVKIFLKLSFLF